MARTKAKILWRVILVLALLSPFVFLSSTLRPWVSSSTFTLAAQEVIYPFEYVWDSGTRLISGVWTQYIDLTNVSEENTKLSKEIAILKSQQLDYDEKQNEIGRLRSVLGFAQHFKGTPIIAEIVGSQVYPSFKTVRISKGKQDGVRIGMPVVTAEGVVGRIIRSGQKFSDVHLLLDTNFNIDVLVQRTRIRGVLKGSDNDLVLKLNRRVEIRIGDTLVTLGIVGGFAKGLPIGKVVRISYESDNISQTITVEPWVNFDRIEEVIVLENHDKELQKIMETAGEDWLGKPFRENDTAGGCSMDSALRSRSYRTWQEIARSWRPRPNSGSLIKDVIFVVLLVFFQTTVFPTLLGSFGVFDLLTPWLVISAVRQRPLQATLIALVGAFALETKLAVPMGLYMCSYWIMISVFFQVRPALSWRYRTPWLASYAISVVWIVLFETFVLMFLHENWNFTATYFFQEIWKIGVALGFGMYLSSEWMRIDAEEPVPQ